MSLSHLSDQLDVTRESSKIVKLALTWVEGHSGGPLTFLFWANHAVYSDFFSSKRKCKSDGYHDVLHADPAGGPHRLRAHQLVAVDCSPPVVTTKASCVVMAVK
jgi:hypothetical protein